MSCLNQCAHWPCVSGIKSNTHLLRHPVQLVQNTIFPSVRRSWLTTHGIMMWYLGSRILGYCWRSYLCRPKDPRTEHWLSVPHRAAQCLVQRCGTDPVMWLSVWGSKRLPWVGLDCFLTSRLPVQAVWKATLPFFQAPGPILDSLFWLVSDKSHESIRTCRVTQGHLNLWLVMICGCRLSAGIWVPPEEV